MNSNNMTQQLVDVTFRTRKLWKSKASFQRHSNVTRRQTKQGSEECRTRQVNQQDTSQAQAPSTTLLSVVGAAFPAFPSVVDPEAPFGPISFIRQPKKYPCRNYKLQTREGAFAMVRNEAYNRALRNCRDKQQQEDRYKTVVCNEKQPAVYHKHVTP
ncbi:hypothetical protein F2P81_009483 [Scophthalmus maximus]|uniref:Uncharacterized protein n=1 Tax=Scophthalmus maximus TaxID=52904 RepID=A0A6A4T1X7_SCOMX|nr:hypothetical protein F2P81_009483 [Scophthalmus maximus]